MPEKTLFTRIAEGEIPGEIVYEDDRCFALRDINPQAPLHLLVIPREPVRGISAGDAQDAALFGHLLLTGSKLANEAGYEDFRLVINNGAGAGQSVFHLHVHVLAGRALSWPPG